MSKNINDNNKEMSVDDLVNKLKSNITSPIEEGVADMGERSLKKPDDPDKDIASMLKKFMPEDDAIEKDEFELEETQNQVESFDVEADFDLPEESFDEGNQFVIDDAEVFGEDEASAFAEPEELYLPEDDSNLMEAASYSPAKPKKEKKKGGLFGKKKKSLAEGYGAMLTELGNEDLQAVEKDTQPIAEQEDEQYMNQQNVEQPSESPTADFVSDTESESSENSFDELLNTEIPDLNTLDVNETADEQQKISFEAEAEEAFVPDDSNQPEQQAQAQSQSQYFVFENGDEGSTAPVEEEYFITEEKNPLAFDNEDDTPPIPDASAFGDEEETAFGNETLDDKDINLMLGLGYEDELERQIGKQQIDRIADNLNAEIVDFVDIDSTYAFNGFELKSHEQYRSIGESYKQEYQTMKMRLLGTVIFAVALFLFETISSFGLTMGGVLDMHRYPVIHIMLSLQLLVLCGALSWRQLLIGLRDAITFNPSPSSIPAVATVATVAYDVVMALVSPSSGLYLYNFPASLCLLILVLSDYFDLDREIRSFNTIATRRPKFALHYNRKASEHSVEADMAAVFSGAESAPADDKVLEVKKVNFIENYFRRTNISSANKRTFNVAIYPIIALAIALGVVSYVINKSGVTAVNISVLSVLLGMPLSLAFIYSYPFFSAARKAFRHESAIIGEGSISEYSDATSMVFSDSDVFPTEQTVTKGIKLYDNNAIYYVLYHLTSLYSKIGGPLKNRLIGATAEMGHSEDVKLLRVEVGGVEAIVDDKVKILAGSADFMSDNGIQPDYDEVDVQMTAEGTSILFVALDGVLSAKLYVYYDIDHSFEEIINSLAEEGIETVVKTLDPNIDENLLLSKLQFSRYPAKVAKESILEADEQNGVDSLDSGIVARNSLSALADSAIMCNRIRRLRKMSRNIGIVSSIVSVVIMVLLSMFSSGIKIPSLYVALYQIFWMLPTILFTKLRLK